MCWNLSNVPPLIEITASLETAPPCIPRQAELSTPRPLRRGYFCLSPISEALF